MRFLPVSLLFALCTSAIAGSKENKAGEDDSTDVVLPSVFNGLDVPPMLEIEGEKFDATVKDGWWIVKHHS